MGLASNEGELAGCTDKYLDEELVADYDSTVQDVFIKAAKFALLSCSYLDALSRAQDMEAKEVKGLPSWVPDLSVEEMDYFESEESYLKAANNQKRYTLDFEGDVLILAAAPFDRIVAIGETFDEIQSNGSIVNFLKVFLDIGSEYEHTKEDITVAMRRVLIADRLDLDSQDEVGLMDHEYDMQAAFEKWCFRLICYALKTDPVESDSDSDSDSESDSESADEAEKSSAYYNTKESEPEVDVQTLDLIPKLVPDVQHKLRLQNDLSNSEVILETAMETPEDTPKETMVDAAETSEHRVGVDDPTTPSAGDLKKARKIEMKAEMKARKAVRISLLETLLDDPMNALHSSMSILGFPDPSSYALLEPTFRRGAAACQHRMSDFPVDELFESMWCGNDPFASSWFYTARNKIPFRTEKGYIGLGVETIRVGDEVFFVEGASAMYVLRPTVPEEDKTKIEEEEKEERDEHHASTSAIKDETPAMADYSNSKEEGEKMDVPMISPIEDSPSHLEIHTSNTNSQDDPEEKADKSQEGNEGKHHSGVRETDKEELEGESDEGGADTESTSGSTNGSDSGSTSSDSSSSSGLSYDHGGNYTLAGEVYMHGIMYGEAFKDGKGDDIVYKQVRIH
jgi:hypothetical protein